MIKNTLTAKGKSYLNHLCLEIPTRRVGTGGNRAASEFIAEKMTSFGFEVEHQPFVCIDWTHGQASLSIDDEQFQIQIGPFSNGCQVQAELAVASRVEQLEGADLRGKLLLLHGEIAREQLMPKNFPFYNPEEHQKIYKLLETKKPAAILSATGRNPELAGAVYPFPLIEDGDFDIPNAYMTEEEGARLASRKGERAALGLEAERCPARGENLAALKGSANRRVVVSAHLDAKEGTPGALDNAAGVVVLLLLAELLNDYDGGIGVELVPFNGEDHYSAAGEITYLQANKDRLDDILLNINIDAAGYREYKDVYSLYECTVGMEEKIHATFKGQKGLTQGDPWYQGDHMIFAMQGIPALAITSAGFMEIESRYAHTHKDRPELVDCGKLLRLASSLSELIVEISKL